MMKMLVVMMENEKKEDTRVYVLKEAKLNKENYLNHAINLNFKMF
jgi:hypothetical protein